MKFFLSFVHVTLSTKRTRGQCIRPSVTLVEKKKKKEREKKKRDDGKQQPAGSIGVKII